MSTIQQNYFELFGLPVQFALDTALLDQRYRTLQAEVHPDRFVAASANERMQSMQWATQANEAYRILKHPTSRARYLLQLHGVDTEEESNTVMPADFLMLQMEWREAVEEAFDNGDVTTLESLLKEMREQARTLEQSLEDTLDRQRAWQASTEIVRKLSFIDKISNDVEHKISKLEDE
ncbi:Fe-S protein assembly co-chaperone HscB [Methylobacillus flagellatus]|uniref:Co-chaperone protein HscB homolog n=1 Tax=Methylobacillus flagellatus (strain ATCC 51484 / DSM 6875 / VKM B-1610 / KT) TaxID=265072 RepID=Q1H364_METFK|nr:Fe-S protein assembly co-chaperone HscB [Methylobacillus flagellatus]ABE49073.1 co-chaperone Hsc20 [Methylobacillus flagellatus KT]